MKQTILAFFVILATIYSCKKPEENTSSYLKIDKNLSEEIETKLANYNKHFNCEIEYSRYENDDLVEKSKTTPALSFTRLIDNVTTVTGFSGIDEGFGFILIITKDTTMIKTNVESTQPIFKLKENDTPQFGLFIPCKYQKVMVVNKPKFNNEEIISGKIELKSDNYYEMINNEFKSVRLEMKAYFISEPLPIVNKEYKTLVKQE